MGNGGFHSHGGHPIAGMVYFMEHPEIGKSENAKWMRTGGIPILGNPQITIIQPSLSSFTVGTSA
jgi:hypothetical protein